MVHILLLVLKIIGIILLSVTGILLLLLFAVLFVPIRYKAQCNYYEKFFCRIQVGWLFNIIRLKAFYDGNFSAKAKLFMFTLYNSDKKDEKTVFDQTPSKDLAVTESKTARKDYATKNNGEGIKRDSTKEIPAKSVIKDTNEKNDIETDNTKETEEKADRTNEINKEKLSEETKKPQQSEKHDKQKKHKNISAKVKDIISTKDKVKAKINDVKAVINDEDNKEMVSFLYGQLKKLLKEIMPAKYNINIHYGCDDPYITGQILMYVSVFYGLSGIDMNITPDFDKEIIEGDIYIRGRIRIYKLVLIAFRVYRNERFRKLVLKR